MLTISSELVAEMVARARADHPIETCGLIAGPAGSDRPVRCIPMHNAARSTDFFQFDPQQQLRVWREMATHGEEPVVIYHSHTHSRAYPSRDDVALAGEPHAHYVLIATAPGSDAEVRSYRIQAGRVVEEILRIVEPESGPVPANPHPLQAAS